MRYYKCGDAPSSKMIMSYLGKIDMSSFAKIKSKRGGSDKKGDYQDEQEGVK